MEKIIVVNGITNPEHFTKAEIVSLSGQPGIVMSESEVLSPPSWAEPDEVIDLGIPDDFTVKFFFDELSHDYYVRHYHVSFPTQDGCQITVNFYVMKSKYTTDLLLSLSSSESIMGGVDDPDGFHAAMAKRTPEFIAEAFEYKLKQLFPIMTPEEVTKAAGVMRAQMMRISARPTDVYLSALTAVGVPIDAQPGIFGIMATDVGCALSGLGPDILEMDQTAINWTC